MSISKDLLPKKSPKKVIPLKTEPQAKKTKKSGKPVALVEPAPIPAEPVRGKTLKSKKLLQEQAEYQSRVDAALSNIPEILADLHETRNDIQSSILSLREDQQLSSERIREALGWLKETGVSTSKRVSRYLQLTVYALIVLLLIGIYLVYDSKASSQLLLQKISGIETAVNQSELKNELRETRRQLSDELRVSQQSLNENKKVTQSVMKEIQKLNKAVSRLNEMERLNTNN